MYCSKNRTYNVKLNLCNIIVFLKALLIINSLSNVSQDIKATTQLTVKECSQWLDFQNRSPYYRDVLPMFEYTSSNHCHCSVNLGCWGWVGLD